MKTNILALTLAMAIGLTGCATTSCNSSNVVTGAATGAVVGGVIGAVSSGGSGALKGAGIGAAVGAAASTLFGGGSSCNTCAPSCPAPCAPVSRTLEK